MLTCNEQKKKQKALWFTVSDFIDVGRSKKLNTEDQSEMLGNLKRLFRGVKAGSWRLGFLFPGKRCILWRHSSTFCEKTKNYIFQNVKLLQWFWRTGNLLTKLLVRNAS